MSHFHSNKFSFQHVQRRWYLIWIVLACMGCSVRRQSEPTFAPPTPTIAAVSVASSVPVNAIATSVSINMQSPAPSTTPEPPNDQIGFTYVFPAYLPNGVRVAPNESRIARENEIGTTAGGFYLVTLNGNQQKLVIGGGSTDALPISGEQRQIWYDGATALLTTSGEQRQLVFVRNKAKYFVYGRGISEQELILVAESLVPIDLAALRDLAAGK